MSESKSMQPSDTGNPPRRRAGDHGGRDHGVQVGGRRRSDQQSILPRSKVGLLAVAVSYLFSVTLLALAFTAPFRRGSSSADTVEANDVKLEYAAKLDAEQYVDYTRRMDDRVMDAMRRRGQTVERVNKREVSHRWKQSIESRKKRLEAMRREAGEKGFTPGTVEWQFEKDLEKVAGDAPIDG